MSEITNTDNKKKFKAEHFTQIIFGAAIIYGLYLAVPYLLGAIHGAILLAILGAMVYVALDGGFRRLISTGYKVLMRSITSLFVRTNPWSIVKVYIKDLKKSREQMNEHITQLAEAIGNNDNQLEKNAAEIKDNLLYANKEKSKGNMESAAVYANQVGRLSKFNDKLEKLNGKSKYLEKFLEKLYEKVGYKITDLENELAIQEKEYKTLKAGSSAFSKAMNIYNGNVDALDMKNMAIEEIELQLGNFRGQIDKALKDSSKFLQNMNTIDEVNIEKGLNLLDSFNNGEYDHILKQLDANGPIKMLVNSKNIAQPANNSKFGSLID